MPGNMALDASFPIRAFRARQGRGPGSATLRPPGPICYFYTSLCVFAPTLSAQRGGSTGPAAGTKMSLAGFSSAGPPAVTSSRYSPVSFAFTTMLTLNVFPGASAGSVFASCVIQAFPTFFSIRTVRTPGW